jgi:hypothetical protein
MGNLHSVANDTIKGLKAAVTGVIHPTIAVPNENNAAAHNSPVTGYKRPRSQELVGGSLLSKKPRAPARPSSSSSASDTASAFKLTSIPKKNSLGNSNLTSFDSWRPVLGEKTAALTVLPSAFPSSSDGCSVSSTAFHSSSDGYSTEASVPL